MSAVVEVNKSMVEIIGVRFRRGGKIYFYDPDRLSLAEGDEVIVPTARGVEFGVVVRAAHEMCESCLPADLKKVIRRATDRDKSQMERNQSRRETARQKCVELIRKHNLQMKLVDVDYVFDGNSITFYFTSDGRVDFRELVKDLASALKTRIEMRQVGVRDEAKAIGGLGPCGRPRCCAMFLDEFEPVSIRMAKEQNLPLNPSKISGICGRLMCCLRYEQEAYRDFLRRVPKVGAQVETEKGAGKVTGYDVPNMRVWVEMASGDKLCLDPEDFGEEYKQPVSEGEDEKVCEEDALEELREAGAEELCDNGTAPLEQ
jgi:cell fate regulator YaaT (PSP1 superfamily)